ncbi:MAG: hypothetical protein ACRC1K_16340, partial [Planctomycetia bacterium]
CKRYGDAWQAKNQAELAKAVTPDFAAVWNRMPYQSFVKLPRAGGGSVTTSEKGAGRGAVVMATTNGPMTFELIGDGFDWRVDDIKVPGDDGHVTSLKNYLDVTLTIREMMTDLKKRGGSSFYDSVTASFKCAFERLSREEVDRIRDFLPDLVIKSKPQADFDGTRATVRIELPSAKGPDGIIIFTMVHTDCWRIDDYAIEMPGMHIGSFRKALPIIACITGLSEYAKAPERCDPAAFTCCGSLRESLQLARAMKPFPLTMNPAAREVFSIADDYRSVRVVCGGKEVRMKFKDEGGRAMLASVESRTGDRWADVAHLIKLKSNIEGLAQGKKPWLGMLATFGQGTTTLENAAAVDKTPSAGGLENAVAEVVEPAAPKGSSSVAAAAPPVFRPAPAVSPVSAVESTPTVRRAEYEAIDQSVRKNRKQQQRRIVRQLKN